MSNVRMPRQAVMQLEAAEALEMQLAQANATPTGVVSITEATNATEQAGQNLEQAPAPAPVPTAPVVETPPQVSEFEQRYRTLKGKYDAEVPRLNQTVAELRSERDSTGSRLTQLENELRQLREKPAAVLDPKDVESFGADLVEMVRRQASAELDSAVKAHIGAMVERITRLEQGLTGVSQATAVSAEQQFRAALKQAVPDFEAINASDAFLEWLGEEDEVYGVPRQEALTRSGSNLDVARTASIFNAFKRTKVVPPVVQANELASQLTPSRSGSSAPPAAVNTVMISQSSITQFYNDVRRGVYDGREAEAQRIETEINLALQSGRVV